MKKCTLCFLREDDNILLAMKKRGFGAGRWNGVGGKVKMGEKVVDAAKREVQEEIKVEVDDLIEVAKINFFFPYVPAEKAFDQEVHVYVAKKWLGEPVETEEMAPKWFRIEEIPYELMWSDDKLWLPRVLENKRINAQFTFDKHEGVESYAIDEIDE